MLKKLTKKFDFYIIVFIIFINLFWLPSNSFWLFYPQKTSAYDQAAKNLINYQHPLVPSANQSPPPNLTALAYVLIDNETNTILLSKNPHLRIYPASTTKLATALTALNIYPLDEQVTIKDAYTEGKVMELAVGERLTVKSLISALLVYSANDSAFTLASHHPQGIPGFIDQMNLLAQKYYLTDTHFVNFDGIHDPNHYSSAYDLAQLGRISTKNPFVQETVKTKELVVTDLDNKYNHLLITTNELLGVVPEIEGLKTGWTPEAGGCFVGEINIYGHRLISVVAQSPDRFADTKLIVDWAKKNITWNSYSP